MSQAEHNKELLVRLTEIVNQGDLDAIGEVATGQIAAEAARLDRTVPANPFPTLKMELVNATAEDDKVVGHFKCSGIHRGKWRGTGPTGRRFENIDEIYILRVEDRTLATVLVVVEDNLTRLQQLGLDMEPSR